METFIILLFFNEQIPFLSGLPDVGFLWLTGIGAIGLMLIALLLQVLIGKKS